MLRCNEDWAPLTGPALGRSCLVFGDSDD